MRREDVHALEECRVANHALQRLGNLAADFCLVVEAALAILHFPPQVCAGIEPEARRLLRLVA